MFFGWVELKVGVPIHEYRVHEIVIELLVDSTRSSDAGKCLENLASVVSLADSVVSNITRRFSIQASTD